MTDRTTELREKLTERGVEFATDDSAASKVTTWTTQNGVWIFDCDYMEPLNEKPGTIGAKTELMIFGYTPEQAIAATLGSERISELEAENERLRKAGYEIGYHDAMKAEKRGGTLTAEQVSKATYAHSIHADCADADWQAIADELNARAERTCVKFPSLTEQTCIVRRKGFEAEFGYWRCSECNCENFEGARYCMGCGAKVVGE